MNKIVINSLILSVAAHVVLLAVFFIGFKKAAHFKVPGVRKPVMAYLANTHYAHHEVKSVSKLMPQKIQLTQAINGHFQFSHHKKQHKQANKNKSVMAKNKQLTGKKLNQLVILIYKAINQQKVYPQMAQTLGQSGTALVRFTLTINGHFTQVTIVKSSGYRDLDRAAIKAVQMAVPLQHARHFLKASQAFTIPIDFEH